ncbi:thiamine pyrophosphate-dependent dehydrogenase E1 component subunit alpha [Capillimicrobium parvum]|nr:thiamine pyrophosphate-dependent dehydrogenase E1 component subunit alpha [Capillimicrobium parvum]
MLLMRRFDEAALSLVQSGRIRGTVHPYIGQEGCAAGVGAVFEPGDLMVSNHRGHGHCIAAGVEVDRMMAELFGRAGGSCHGMGGSMHIADFERGMLGANGIVGAGVPHAVGAALSLALDGHDRVVIAFFGDGATGQGVVFESMNLAALWSLPVLFVCETNGIASASALTEVLAVETVAEIAAAHGIASERVEGADVVEVRASAQRAADAIRSGGAPRLIECVVDRWGPHASRLAAMPDHRSAEDLAAARRRDPIARLREALIADGTLASPACDELDREAREAVEGAIAFAEMSPYPELAKTSGRGPW